MSTQYRIAHTFFSLSVLLGILPFVLSAIPFSSFSCSGDKGELSLLCKIGVERSAIFFLEANTVYYVAIFISALLAALYCRYWLKFIALAPLALLVFICVSDSAPKEKHFIPERFKPVLVQPDLKVKQMTKVVANKQSQITSNMFQEKQNVSSQAGNVIVKAERSFSNKLENNNLNTNHFQDNTPADNKSNRPNVDIERPSAPVHDKVLDGVSSKFERASKFYTSVWPLYAIASLLGLLLFVSANSIRSAIFLCLPATMSIIIIWQNSLNSLLEISYAFYPVLLLLIIAVVLRLLVLTVIQNTDIIANMGLANILINCLKTLSRWWLIALVAIAAMVYTSVFDRIVTEAVYCIGAPLDDEGQCKPNTGLITDFPQHASLEADINASVDQFLLKLKVV